MRVTHSRQERHLALIINDAHWGETRTINLLCSRAMRRERWEHIYCTTGRTIHNGFSSVMTVLGALLYVAIESIPALNKSSGGNNQSWWALLTMDRYSKLILALGVSSIVFLFKDAGFLKAIKLDSGSLMAYLTYGFCAGALGLEAVLKKVKELL